MLISSSWSSDESSKSKDENENGKKLNHFGRSQKTIKTLMDMDIKEKVIFLTKKKKSISFSK